MNITTFIPNPGSSDNPAVSPAKDNKEKIKVLHKAYIDGYPDKSFGGDKNISVAQSGDASDRVEETTVSVAVIDRDGSTISQGIKRYVESVGEAQELEDSERAMQDATAQNRIDYIPIHDAVNLGIFVLGLTTDRKSVV